MNFENFSWDQISQIYDRLSELDSVQREDYYKTHQVEPELKNELESLIELGSTSENYFNNLSENIISPAIFEISDLPPSSGKVYNYKILKKVGRGGMGSVYLAERDDDAFKSRVAVKILRRGLKNQEIIAGFRSERQILAQLNHSNITHLLDGGMTTDGRPYFVMEYVDGKPITEYCDEKKLTIADRVELFLQICDTLAYAHQNLVIHRDLKPANIMVTGEGKIKLLDFGIAKFIDENSSLLIGDYVDEKRLLTPEYASPEQIKGIQMNTSSDIYQLGLVFYKLICGQLPFTFQDIPFSETERIILQDEPPLPSERFHESDLEVKLMIAQNRSTNRLALKKDLSNDLDHIALMAIQKDPENRYKSVRELKEDLVRFQTDRPVISRGNDIWYKSVKYIIRNKFNIAVVLFFLTMLNSFVFIYNFSVTEQRNYAQLEAIKASQVTSFLIDLFEANDPNLAQGVDFTASELLEMGKERIELLEDMPDVQADLYEVTGQIYRKLGQFEEAEKLFNTALEIRENQFGTDHQDVISIHNQIGLLYSDMGHFDRAEQILRNAINLGAYSYIVPDPVRSEYISNLAYILRRTGKYEEAEEMYRESYRIRMRSLGSEHPSTIENLSSIGVTLLNKGDYNNAKTILQDVLELRLKILGRSHPDVAMSMNSLGAVLLNTGNFFEAEIYFRESLDIRTKIFGEMHPKVALTMNNLGITLREQELFDDAHYFMKKALDIRKESLGDNNVNSAISMFTKGKLLLLMEEPQKAIVLLESAHDIFSSQLGMNHSFTARSRVSLGLSYLQIGETNIGEKLVNQGFNDVLTIHNPNTLEIALAHWDYSYYLRIINQPLAALEHLKSSHNILRVLESDESIRVKRLEKNILELTRSTEYSETVSN